MATLFMSVGFKPITAMQCSAVVVIHVSVGCDMVKRYMYISLLTTDLFVGCKVPLLSDVLTSS